MQLNYAFYSRRVIASLIIRHISGGNFHSRTSTRQLFVQGDLDVGLATLNHWIMCLKKLVGDLCSYSDTDALQASRFSWYTPMYFSITCNAPYIKRNILFFTLLFIVTGFPSSSSNPAAPPSPDIPSSFSRNSSSNSAIVLRLGLTSASVGVFVSPAGFCWLGMADDVSCDEVA